METEEKEEQMTKVLAEQLEQQRMERERDEMAYREGFIRGFFGIAPGLNNEGMNEWQDTDAFLDGLVDGRRGQRR